MSSVFTLFGMQASFNLRGYWEFRAQNLLKGEAAFPTLVSPLCGAKPPARGSQSGQTETAGGSQ